MAETNTPVDPYIFNEDSSDAVGLISPNLAASVPNIATKRKNKKRGPNKRRTKPSSSSDLAIINDIFGESSSNSNGRVNNVNSESNSERDANLIFSKEKRGPNKRRTKPSSSLDLAIINDIFGESSSNSNGLVNNVNSESNSERDANLFFFKVERDPNKRRIKPPSNPELMSIDSIFGRSSSDNDVHIKDNFDNNTRKSNSDKASSLLISGVKRDPSKRKIKPPSNPELLEFDDIFSESSSDSDFRIEDHCNYSSEPDSGDASNLTSSEDGDQDNADNDDENEIGCSDKIVAQRTNVMEIDEDNSKEVNLKEIVDKMRICSVCLGDASDASNEIINCDRCGVSVHEACYGVQNTDDSGSIHSSVSSYSTEPWFCEPCKAGIENPTCELCPNLDGIFKETDCGQWVHLVCALYVPGTEFGDIASFSKITLFPKNDTRWGIKSCSLCKDKTFMNTGITIACDAGMCRSNFHVTCAQQEGGLSEVTNLATEQTDPYYGHCKLHVDKFIAKKQKRNWEILQLRTKQMKSLYEQQSQEKSAAWKRNQRILEKLQVEYNEMKKNRNPKLTSKSKIGRSITTSASACRALSLKASLMGINTTSQETIEAQVNAVRDVHKKWHVSPTFSPEFISYFFDRERRIKDLRNEMNHLTERKNKLLEKQITVQENYDQAFARYEEKKQKCLELKNTITSYHNILILSNPNIRLPDLELHVNQCPVDNIINSSTPTLAALKPSTGIPLNHADSSGIIDNEMPLTLNNKCGICNCSNDQHLLTKCDKCCIYYHLGCLTPPLTRMPKKTKSCGWQCSECDNNCSDDESKTVDLNAPRNLRYGNRKQSTSHSLRSSSTTIDHSTNLLEQNSVADVSKMKKHKRRREIFSPELIKKYKRVKSRKRKHTHDEANTLEPGPTNDMINKPPQHGIKLFIKSVPNDDGIKTISSQLLIPPPIDEIPHTSTSSKPGKSVAPHRII